MRDRLSRRFAWFALSAMSFQAIAMFRRPGSPATERSPRGAAGFQIAVAAQVTFSSRDVRSLVGAHPVRDRLSRRSAALVLQHVVGDVLVAFFRDRARLRRASEPLPRPGSLSLACPRESNQREGHPAWRCLGYAQPVREGRPGFSTGLLPGRKVPDVLSGTPAGPARPPLTAPQGLVEGSCRGAAHRVATPVAAVRCGSAPCARPWTDRVASIRDGRDDARPRRVATLRSRTGCAPTEVGRNFASTHPSPHPSPRRGEGEKTAVRRE